MNGKLLVVDDEIWFREGLVNLISSNPLGWEVVGEASDGEEAKEVVGQCKPDLVITDINMPILDGLDLTAWLSQEYPDIMVIILTGYRDFEYARRALRYGAVEFMLKPFSLDEAYRVLNKSYEQFRLKQLAKRLEEQEQQVELFRKAIFGLPTAREAKEEWEQRWRSSSFSILYIQSYCPTERGYTSSDINLLHYAVSNIVQELLQIHQPDAIFLPLYKDTFAFLLQTEDNEQSYTDEAASALQRYLGLQCEWVSLGDVQRFDELHIQFGKLQERQLGSTSEIEMTTEGLQLKEELLSFLLNNDLKAAKTTLSNYIQRGVSLELHICKKHIYTLVSVISGILLSDFKQFQAIGANDMLNPRHILDFNSVEELLDWAKDKCSEFLQMFERWLDERQNNIVYRAKQYMLEHYRETCSLQSASSVIHVSPNYLSNLFKKETGISYTNYLTQIRIEKAKALLQGTKMRMTEIAEAVGFDNSSYFTVVFKQVTGQSPREYRKSYEESQDGAT